MPFTSGRAVPLHWDSVGDGRPLVLLHGLGGDSTFWDGTAELLTAPRRLILPDLRGSGRTPPSPGGHSMADLSDDVLAILDDIGADRIDLLGFSMGGCAAQQFALDHPDRVDHLVLAATFPVMNPQSRMFLDAVHDVYRSGATDRQMFDLICPWLFSTDFLADPAHADWFVYPEGEEQDRDAWSAAYQAQRLFDATARLAQITAPTLVVAGGHDRLAPVSDALKLVQGIPGATLHSQPEAGHLVNVEAPEAFWNRVETFLDH